MASQHIQDHDANIYLTVTVSSGSPLYHNPEQLVTQPALTHIGAVGQLRDVQLLSVPREEWNRVQGDVLRKLNSMQGVLRVDVQEPPRMRSKRDTGDL